MSGPSSRTPEGLAEPLPRPLADALRRAALDQARGEHRRRFPSVLHVGDPGGHEEAFVLAPGDPDDHALRTDVLAAMHRIRRPGGSVPLVWLTRAGDLDLQDVDAAWLGPLLRSAEESEVDLVYVVVTRHGWWDPRSGLRTAWRRLREK